MPQRLVLVLTLLLATATPTWAADARNPFPYRVTTIDLPVPTEGLAVRHITEAGTVVGTYTDRQGRTESFIKDGTRLSLRPILILAALNTRGDLLGTLDPSFGGIGFRGILFADGEVTVITVPLTPSSRASLTEVSDLNEARQVVGDYRDEAGVFHGFLYDAVTTTYTTIPAPFPTSVSALTGINNLGHLTGIALDDATPQGFVRVDETVIPLLAPGAVGGTDALGLNDADVVVGIASLDPTGSGGNRGFVYHEGTYTLIQVPGAVYTELSAITNRGVLGGRYVTPDGVSHGVILTPRAHGAPQVSETAGAVTSNGVLEHTALDLGPCPVGSLRWACRSPR